MDMDTFFHAVITGIGATLVMDLWSLFQRYIISIPPLKYALVGLLTLFAPFMILQPAFGFGIAASRTPRPWLARLLSVLTHVAYGLGLYIAAFAIRF